MSAIQLLISLVFIGFILWLVNTYIPMQSSIKGILNIAVVVIVALNLLMMAGII